MADYTINVDVSVADSELSTLESRINDLKSKPVEIDIKTNLSNIKTLSKDIKTAVEAAERSIAQSQKKSKKSLMKTLFDPGELDTQSIASAVKNVKSLIGKDLNLGEVKLTVNDAIFRELDTLQNKLNEIKTTAKSMGSIKLSVADNMTLQDGKIIVGENSTKTKAKSARTIYNEQIKELKDIAKARAALKKQQDILSYDNYATQMHSLHKRKREILGDIESSGHIEKLINAKDVYTKEFDKAIKDNEKALHSLDSFNSTFEKETVRTANNFKKFAEVGKISGSKEAPLDKKLTEGYYHRLDEYKRTMNNISTLNEKVKTFDDSTSIDERMSAQTELESYVKYAQSQEKILNNLSQFYKITDTDYKQQRYIGLDLDTTSSSVTDNMDAMVHSLANGNKYTKQYNAELGKMTATIDRGSGVMETFTLKYNKGSGNIDSSLSKISQQVKPLSSYISELGGKFKTLSQYLISNFGFEALIMGVTSGVTAIRDLDTAMTELKKTSEGTRQEYRAFTEQANKDAKAIGSTTVQMTSSAADWSRLGYNLEESSTMARTTGILKNVSEFESIEAATESMVGIMAAYNVAADDSMQVVDKLNVIGNNFSISTDKLATGLQIAGSALQVGGNDMDQSIALITAMNSSIQDVNQAARAARTVSMRLHGVSAETLQAEGEDIEGLIDTVPKLEAEIKSLTAINGEAGISLTDATGRIKSDFEFLLELAQKWDAIGKADIEDGMNRQSAILEALAGKNRANALASLLNNAQMLENVYNMSSTGFSGSAQNELNTYLDSVNAKIVQVQESWAQIWQSEASTNTMKGLLDIADSALGLIGNIGIDKVLGGALGIASAKFFNWGRINYQLVL